MLRLAPYSRQTALWKRSSSSGGQKCNNQRTGKRWQAGKNFVMGGHLFSGIRTVFRKLCGHKSHTTAGKYASTHGHQCNQYGQKSNRGGQVAPLPQRSSMEAPVGNYLAAPDSQISEPTQGSPERVPRQVCPAAWEDEQPRTPFIRTDEWCTLYICVDGRWSVVRVSRPSRRACI